MSLREVPSSRPLLARKGAASPASLRVAKGGPGEPSLRSIEKDGEIALELAIPDVPAGLKASAAGERGIESTPAASLLPFNLLRQKFRPETAPDLAADEPDLVPGDLAELPPADAAPQTELALLAKSATETSMTAVSADSQLDSEPELRPEPRLKTRLEAPAPAPTPDPDWRVGVAASARKRATRGGWLLPVGALTAAFAALIVGWTMVNPDLDLGFGLSMGTSAPPAPGATGQAPDDGARPTLVEPPPPVAAAPPPPALQADLPPPVLSAAPDRPAPDSAVNTGDASGTPAKADSPAAESAAAPPPATTAAEETPPAPGEPAPGAPAAVKPTVDVVRLDANGEAVIAGRAAPNSELIVLDNGKPIGTVKADAFGEWVFVPEAALPTGGHEFGLVLKTVEESVSLPAPSKPSLPPAPEPEPAAAAPTPASDASEAETGAKAKDAPDDLPSADDNGAAVSPAPVPARKPVVGDVSAAPNATPADSRAAAGDAAAQVAAAATAADFVVQLASVKTRAGAEQEWRTLQQRFPEILADMVPALDEVKLADHGTVVRVRTGAFDSQHEAASLCARLAAKSQRCLVVRVSAGN
ncbi:MAG TPA: SPOR domain-containing protein [Kiloniellales bacterium]